MGLLDLDFASRSGRRDDRILKHNHSFLLPLLHITKHAFGGVLIVEPKYNDLTCHGYAPFRIVAYRSLRRIPQSKDRASMDQMGPNRRF
jgi:hypothetical protein